MVTYEDIRKRRLDLDSQITNRSDSIRRAVKTLVDAYIDSLKLPAPAWRSLDGAEMPYVRVLVVDDNQDGSPLVEVHPLKMSLTENYHAHFWLETVVDDSPRGGDAVKVNLDIYDDEGQVKAVVSMEDNRYRPHLKDPLTLSLDGKTFNTEDICNVLKDCVLMSITDPGLDSAIKSFSRF